MGFSLKKLLTEDLNPFDGPKKPQPASTAQSASSGLSVGVARPQANVSVATTAPRPKVVVQAPVQVPQLPQVQIAPTQQLKANGQVYNNTSSIRPAAPIQSPLVKPNSFVNAIDRALSPVGAGVLRSGVGTAESLSGLYDLATPGVGQNRFGKSAQQAGANLDQAVKDANYSKVGYKGAQAVTDVGTFLLPGTQVKSTKLAAPISRALALIADYNKAGNIAARTAGYLARPDVATNIATGTALSTGLRSNRGQDINAGNLATDLGLNTAGALGLKAAGKGIQAGTQATTKLLRNNNIIRPFDINDVERAAINRTQQARQGYGSNMGDPDYELGLQALQRNNIDPYNPAAVDTALSRLDSFSQRPSLLNNQVGAIGKDVRPSQFGEVLQQSGVAPNRTAKDKLLASKPANFFYGDKKLVQDAKKKAPVKKSDLSIENPELLPTTLKKRVSNLDKAARSTSSIIERQGERGKELKGLIDAARDNKEIYLSELQQQMPSVTKLARKGKNAIVNKDFENFVDATQGLAQPKNDLVARAVQEWQTVHPTIRERGVNAGLEIGDLGPTYYPHFIDYDRIFKDKNTYNASINHLVQTGQAESPEAAIKLLNYAKDISRNRQFGNLEASREIDLPFYDKTPNSLISYLNGSAKRIANTEALGASDEKALKLIADAGKEGYDTEAMKNAFDVAVGAKQYNPTASNISGNIRKYTTTTRLGLGALTNVSQNVNTGIVTGHLRTLASAVKQLDPKTRQFVADTGVISDAVLNDIKTQSGYSSFSQKVLGKAINKVTAPGFGLIEKTNRSIAATAGRDYALRLAQKGDEQALRKLKVTGPIKNKTLNEKQQIEAAREIVRKTQFKVDPQDLPGWTDSPGGKLVSQFRTFSYNQGKFFSNEVLKPLAKGNVQPLARVLAALPVGYGLYEARRVIDGRPEEEDKKKVGLASFSKIGGAGLALDLYQSLNPVGSKYIPTDRRISMTTGAIAGPSAGTLQQGIGAISEAVQRKNTPADETRLEGKVAVGKNEDSYTDATPAARFALQQVPIVGTPIKNRVLPFKKESDADAGKTIAPTNDPKTAKEIKANNKAKSAAFKKSLSTEDYEISQLSKKDQQKLIDSGAYTRDKIDGLNSYTKNKKVELGLESAPKAETPKTKYDTALKSYNDSKSKLSKPDQITKEKELSRLKAKSDFDNDIVDLYEFNKTDLYNYVNKDPDGKAIVDKLLKLDDALVATGAASKLRDKYGKLSLNPPKAKGSSGGKGSNTSLKKYAASLASMNKAASGSASALRDIVGKQRISSSKQALKKTKVALKKGKNVKIKPRTA